MSEGPKLYTNKPKKGKTQKQFFAVKKQSFILLFFFFCFQYFGFRCLTFDWLFVLFYFTNKQHNWKNFKRDIRKPRSSQHHHHHHQQWELSLLQLHHLSHHHQKSHLLAVTSSFGLCFWLSILLLEVPFFLLFLNLQCMCVCECEYLFVYKVIEFIKWCNWF